MVLLPLDTQTGRQFRSHNRQFSFFDIAMVGKSVHYDSLLELLAEGPDEAEKAIIQGARRHKASLVLVDGFGSMRRFLGPEQGVAVADHIYYVALRHAVDLPSMYVELLLADDDDGDLDNGTPHRCAIDTAFSRHGLADPDATGAIGSPEVDDLDVLVPFVPPEAACPALDVAAMRLRWRTGGAELSDPIEMTRDESGFRARIPDLAPGTAVDYQIEVLHPGGATELRPNNPADPLYQLFHGETEPLYCTNFHDPPATDGWASGGYPPGSEDDWMWGQPWGAPGSGDPASGFTGTRVYGNDLGGIDGDGLYAPGQVTFTDMPEIAVPADAEQVRLQYRRWLNVEDGSFDVAAISGNGGLAWQNAASDAGTIDHADREWRFHDVDLTDKVVDGRITVRFEIAADADIQLGGWNLDDVCLVTFRAPVDAAPDAGPEDDPAAVADDGGCGCRAGGDTGWLATLLVLAGQLRRRRRDVSRHRA